MLFCIIVSKFTGGMNTFAKHKAVAMAEGAQSRRPNQQNVPKLLQTDVVTAKKHLQDAQVRYNRNFIAHVHRTTDKLSPEDSVFVQTKLTDQPHKTASVATGPFSVVAVDTYTITKQHADSSVEKNSCSRVARTTGPHKNPILEPPLAFFDYSRIRTYR